MIKRMKAKSHDNPIGVAVTPEIVQSFLAQQQSKGLSPDTLKSYATALEKLQEFLGPDSTIYPGTIAAWQKKMQQDGYANSTINAHMSAANGLLRYLHRSDLAADMLDWTAAPSPEITRGEYLRLLQTARLMDNPRDYLLVKLLANTDIQLRDLAAVTVENVATGHIPLAGNAPNLVYLPAVLRQDLLEYARSQAIKSGPIFVGRGGKPVNRAVVTWVIQQLAEKARVAPEKATPRALHKLYQTIADGIRRDLEVQARQIYDNMLDAEQKTIGWKDG